MKLSRVRAITVKELIQIWRDPLSLAMAFLMPAMLLFIFGYAITLDVNNIRTVVYDSDKSSLSRELVSEFKASGYFSIIDYLDGYGDIDTVIDEGKAQVALAIPRDFSRNIKKNKNADFQVIIDGSDSNTASIALEYIEAISRQYGQRIKGIPVTPPIDIRFRVWYNEELKSRNFIIPGLMAIIMAVIAALLTSLTIAREWERGTMEQLISTPVKTTELIIGKLIPYFIIGFADIFITLALATFLFNVPFRGTIFLLMVLSSIFLVGGLSIGILISIIVKSQLAASQIAMVSTFLPSFLLSGFMFSIYNMPLPLRIFSHIIPARYYVTILKGIFLKGSTLHFLLFETVLLLVFGTIIFTLAIRKFKKRIS